MGSSSLPAGMPPESPKIDPVVPPKVLPSHGIGHSPAFPSATPGSTDTDIPKTETSDSVSAHTTDSHVPAEGSLAKSLQEKISASGMHNSDTIPTASSNEAATVTPPPQAPKTKKSFSTKSVLTALLIAVVLMGSGATYYLTTRKQTSDDRNRAASEQVTNTERFKTVDEWKAFNQKWMEFNKTEHTWQEVITYAMGEGARYQCDKQIMVVDKEVNYGCDLDAIFAMVNNAAYIKAGTISPQDSQLNEVLDHLITNSAILQLAGQQNIVSLTPQIFNSPDKNMEERFAALTTARQALEKDFVKKIDFEVITIYFHNEIDPKIPLDQAKAAAKAKMDNLYDRLNKGEITMEQAGKEIAADKIKGDITGVSLAQLDPRKIYPQNAYAYVSDFAFGDQIFTDKVYDDELRSLGEGQMSTVRLCKDYAFTPQQFKESKGDTSKFPFVDSCYLIFKLNKIHYGLSKDFEGNTQSEVETKIKNQAKVTKNI